MVEFDDVRVTFLHPSDDKQNIAWEDIAEIGIVTTDEGPYVEDVFFMLFNHDKSSGCAIPQGATGFTELLDRLQRFDGFDNAELIQAMGCTQNHSFTLWKRGAEQVEDIKPDNVPS